jgi:hypothetical protein
MTGFIGASRRGLKKDDGADQDREEKWFHAETVEARSSPRKGEARKEFFSAANRQFCLRIRIPSATNRTCSV